MSLNAVNKSLHKLSDYDKIIKEHPEYLNAENIKFHKSKFFYNDIIGNTVSDKGDIKIVYRCGICMFDLDASITNSGVYWLLDE